MSAKSFFQASPEGAEALVEAITAKKTEKDFTARSLQEIHGMKGSLTVAEGK